MICHHHFSGLIRNSQIYNTKLQSWKTMKQLLVTLGTVKANFAPPPLHPDACRLSMKYSFTKLSR